MNIITADFNWISFLIVIVATIIGMVRSNVRKVAPKAVFQDEPELEPEADMMVEVTNRFNKQEQEVARYNEENVTLEKFQLFAGRISTLMNPATYIVINVATIGILWVGGD